MSQQSEKSHHHLLSNWKPENPQFWENKGKHIARRNLWISVACLLLAFASGCYLVPLRLTSIKSDLISLPISFYANGITFSLRRNIACPLSFMVPIFGGRNWTVLSTVILIIPCVWLGIAIQNTATPYWVFIVIALLCGFAGANFASSMGNISFFFPKSRQGSALGINGGLGKHGRQRNAVDCATGHFLPIFTFLG